AELPARVGALEGKVELGAAPEHLLHVDGIPAAPDLEHDDSSAIERCAQALVYPAHAAAATRRVKQPRYNARGWLGQPATATGAARALRSDHLTKGAHMGKFIELTSADGHMLSA